MRDTTLANTITLTVGTSPVKLLGSSPRRKAFIICPVAAGENGVISVSLRSDVAAGQGILNYLAGATFPTLIDDDQIGSLIAEEWWIVSENGGEVVQVSEFLYERLEC